MRGKRRVGKVGGAAFAVALVVTLGALFAEGAEAQPKGGRRGRAPKPAAAAPATEGRTEPAGREVEEGGKKVKEFRFSGLDVSGRLKSPQILYFLSRVRTEFDRPRLPHRSFMPELVRSAKEPAF